MLADDGQLDALLRSGLLADKLLQIEASPGRLSSSQVNLLHLATKEVDRLLNGSNAASSARMAAQAIDDLRFYSDALPVIVRLPGSTDDARDLHSKVRDFLEAILNELKSAAGSENMPKNGLPLARAFFAAWAAETLRSSGRFFEERLDVNPWTPKTTSLLGFSNA